MKTCPSCGAITDSKFCPECGADLTAVPDTKVCPNCGTTSTTNFCPECGTNLTAQAEEKVVTDDIPEADSITASVIPNDSVEPKTSPEPFTPSNTSEGNDDSDQRQRFAFGNATTQSSKPKKSKKKLFIIIGAVLLALIIICAIAGGGDDDTSSTDPTETETYYEEEEETTTEATTTTEAPADVFTKEEDYESVSYDNLARKPDDYVGSLVKGSGNVLQVLDGDTEVDMRVGTSSDGYDDVVYLVYDPSIVDERVLEDDHVTYYGRSCGLYSYESTMGGEITIPLIMVHKITRD